MPAYKTTINGETAYTTDPGTGGLEAELKKLEPFKHHAAYAALKQEVIDSHEGGAPADSIQDLTAMGDLLSKWRLILSKTDDARKALALDLLKAGEDVETVYKAAQVNWSVLEGWCYEAKKAPKRDEKTAKVITKGTPLADIPQEALKDIDRLYVAHKTPKPTTRKRSPKSQ